MKKSIIEKLGFTKGPWKNSEAYNFSGTYVSYIGDEETHTLFQARHSSDEYTKEQWELDSKLAAGSPKMLEALILQNALDDKDYSKCVQIFILAGYDYSKRHEQTMTEYARIKMREAIESVATWEDIKGALHE